MSAEIGARLRRENVQVSCGATTFFLRIRRVGCRTGASRKRFLRQKWQQRRGDAREDRNFLHLHHSRHAALKIIALFSIDDRKVPLKFRLIRVSFHCFDNDIKVSHERKQRKWVDNNRMTNCNRLDSDQIRIAITVVPYRLRKHGIFVLIFHRCPIFSS